MTVLDSALNYLFVLANGSASFNGSVNATTDLTVGGDVLMNIDNTTSIGTTTIELLNIFVDGTAFIDTLRADVKIGFQTDNTTDIGTATVEAKDVYVDGTAYLDGIRSDVLLDIDGTIDCEGIDIDATSVATVGGVIPITVEGTIRYIPFYETYA